MTTPDTLPNVVTTAPERIYLVIGEGCPPEADFTDCDEVTWCKDKIDAHSIDYVRADAYQLASENERFQRAKADRATAAMYDIHYALKDAGWHPGRTDDKLADIIRARGVEMGELKAELERLRAQVAPAGWTVRDRSDIEPGALDVDGPGVERIVVTDKDSARAARTLHALAAAMLTAAPAQQAGQAPAPVDEVEELKAQNRAVAQLIIDNDKAGAVKWAKGLFTSLDEMEVRAQATASSVVTDAMVDRFLGWRLPDDFSPDGGVTFKPLQYGTVTTWPSGTNLLNAIQARAMLEFVHANPPQAMTREWCANFPGSAAGIINRLAQRVDELEAGAKPSPAVAHQPETAMPADNTFNTAFLKLQEISAEAGAVKGYWPGDSDRIERVVKLANEVIEVLMQAPSGDFTHEEYIALTNPGALKPLEVGFGSQESQPPVQGSQP